MNNRLDLENTKPHHKWLYAMLLDYDYIIDVTDYNRVSMRQWDANARVASLKMKSNSQKGNAIIDIPFSAGFLDEDEEFRGVLTGIIYDLAIDALRHLESESQ